MVSNKKQLTLVVLGIIGLILITLGVSYSFFNYARIGSKENVIDTGKITFLYEEVSGIGKGINLTDSFLIADDTGKEQTGLGKVFEFTIKSDTNTKTGIPYEITVRKKESDTVLDNLVKLYLTKVNGQIEEEVKLDYYRNLTDTVKNGYNEKLLYRGNVPAGSSNYIQNYKLRMWLAEKDSSNNSVDFSPVEVTKYYCSGTLVVKDSDAYNNCSSTITTTTETEYPYNGKEFTITVNVYAEGKTATEQEIINANTTGIEEITINNSTVIKNTISTNNYDYYMELNNEISEIEIDVDTKNSNATVEIESITESQANTIKQLSTKKKLPLNNEDNYYKITVTSENKSKTEEYILKVVKIIKSSDATLSSLSVSNCNISFSPSTERYTCSVDDKESVTVTATTNDSKASINSKLGEKILGPGNNNIEIEVEAEDGTTKTYLVVVNQKSYSSITAVVNAFSSNLSNTIMCNKTNNLYHNCSVYNTIESSLASRDSGEIILTNNISSSSEITVEEGKDIILDLNGYEITSSTGGINNLGTLVINDSKSSGSIKTQERTVRNGGILKINFGTYKSTVGSNTIVASSGTVVIENGTFISTGNSSDTNGLIKCKNANVTIKNGTFTANGNAPVINLISDGLGTITIDNGTFTSSTSSTYATVTNFSTSDINIKGGTYSSGIRNLSSGNINIIQSNPIVIMNGITNNANGNISINQNNYSIYIYSSEYAIENVAGGNVNINASIANKCTATASDTTDGLCSYGISRSIRNASSGSVKVNGGTYCSTKQGINNTSTGTLFIKNASVISNNAGIVNGQGGKGTINICNTTINATNLDLSNNYSGDILKYNKHVVFTSGNNQPVIGTNNGTLELDNDITCE